ncbi:helix-turn-helix domain-containing protein [Virgibacillus xinjiangensis]|uniref:Helix-turn-helix domain-containing protein n=1 Tax=Virgibacillus xinjiangensis TaxID=393090 RepID=A0ABV7CYT0_9BACI
MTNLTSREFGKYIKRKRLDRKWTQERLADETNMDEKYISKLENGKKDPRWSTIAKVVQALDLPSIDIKEMLEKDRT